MKESEFNALLNLLMDTDEYVSFKAKEKLISEFENIEVKIYKFMSDSENHHYAEKLNQVIQEYYFNITKKQLQKWKQTSVDDLLRGLVLISKLFDNEISFQEIVNFFDNIKRLIKIDLQNLSGLEQIRFMNAIVFKELKFKPLDNDNNIINFLISKVIKKKIGSPLLIAIIYKILANKLDIPVIILRNNYNILLAYNIELREIDFEQYLKKNSHNLLIINPADKGYIFTINEMQYSLGEKRKATLSDFSVASNPELIKLIIGKFINFARINKDTDTIQYLVELHKSLL